jgi:hypothetical protein
MPKPNQQPTRFLLAGVSSSHGQNPLPANGNFSNCPNYSTSAKASQGKPDCFTHKFCDLPMYFQKEEKAS